MKNIFLIALMFSVIACSEEKLDVSKAKAVVESLIATTDKEDYQNISQYYTEALNEGEPETARNKKLENLKLMLGDVKSVTLLDANDTTYQDLTALHLKYEIKHSKATSTQDFTVIEEYGEYKIARQNIESVN